MASETESKTIKGLLSSMKKLEESWAFVRGFDPEHTQVQRLRRIALGLMGAITYVIDAIYEDCQSLRRAEEPSAQMTIDDVLSAARKASPGLREDEEDTIRKAALSEGEDGDADLYEDEVEESDISAADLVDLLDEAQPERGWTLGAVMGTSPAERAVMERWCQDGAPGDDVPAAVSRAILEDLDLRYDESVRELLSWVGVDLPEGVAWSSGELRDEAIDWAERAHRADRGEDGVDVPEMPTMFNPPEELFASVLDAIVRGEAKTAAELRNAFEHFAVGYVASALMATGFVRTGTRGEYEATVDELGEAWPERLAAIAANMGARRDPFEGVDVPERTPEEAAAAGETARDAAGTFFSEEEAHEQAATDPENQPHQWDDSGDEGDGELGEDDEGEQPDDDEGDDHSDEEE